MKNNNWLPWLGAVIVCLIAMWFSRRHNNPPAVFNYNDSLKYAVADLRREIVSLKEERRKLQADTINIYNKYNDILRRIVSNKSDTAQLALLREILNKPDPTPVDINTALVEGQRCNDLLDNSRAQLKLCDSTQAITESIVTLQHLDIENAKMQIAQDAGTITKLKESSTKDQSHKKVWRKIALFEGAAIAATSIIFYYRR